MVAALLSCCFCSLGVHTSSIASSVWLLSALSVCMPLIIIDKYDDMIFLLGCPAADLPLACLLYKKSPESQRQGWFYYQGKLWLTICSISTTGGWLSTNQLWGTHKNNPLTQQWEVESWQRGNSVYKSPGLLDNMAVLYLFAWFYLWVIPPLCIHKKWSPACL